MRRSAITRSGRPASPPISATAARLSMRNPWPRMKVRAPPSFTTAPRNVSRKTRWSGSGYSKRGGGGNFAPNFCTEKAVSFQRTKFRPKVLNYETQQVYGLAAEICLFELIQHTAQFRQHRLHELLLRLNAQAFADHLVQHLPGLCQQLQRFAFNQIGHPAMPIGKLSVAPIADERFVWVAG